ncbi:MAG: ATP-binding protein [Myxococcota bacterium]
MDESQRNQLETRRLLSQKLEALGTLAGGIAHDFNNVLTAIVGYAEITRDILESEGLSVREIDEVIRGSQRARELVSQILSFSHDRSHGREYIELRKVVRESVRMARAAMPSTIEIVERIESTATVLAQPTEMHQVLLNLVTNAEHAMRSEGGVLEIGLEDLEVASDAPPPLEPGPHAVLSVRDTGAGMADEVLERLFEPFFTTKGVGEGTGMGLAVVHGVVRSHRGAITVTSEVGEGTTFRVWLPHAERPEEPRPAQRPRPVVGGDERILFVDDEPTLVRLWKERLSRLGYDVSVCTSSVDALELFRATPHRFDLVISDQTMPLMTGDSLARQILRLRPELPVILYTGFSHAITAEQARAMGIREFLMKPLDLEEMAAAIRRVLD